MSATVGRRPRRPPPSYRPGQLLAKLARDLPDHRLEPVGSGARSSARFVPHSPGGPVLEAAERTERHALMGVTKIEFSCRLGGEAGRQRLRLRHTGALRRRGLTVRPDGEVADRLLADADAISALMPLDFRWFELRQDDRGWLAATELMGASEVALRLPPTRSYVRLSADQRDALIASFEALQRVMGRHDEPPRGIL